MNIENLGKVADLKQSLYYIDLYLKYVKDEENKLHHIAFNGQRSINFYNLTNCLKSEGIDLLNYEIKLKIGVELKRQKDIILNKIRKL